ncbi:MULTISPECIES: TIM barrel protein [Romboutsia]|uniref:Oxidoreductase domain protein n=1 Tax=Romboutsia hominis TaxID=1507512 RepID=A0A2P2BSI2_9FIRM|nr:TIM barrel protein [Romboutsia hominis]CEI73309.1 Oxidoreductase domain protein [Romboutsia hominis]
MLENIKISGFSDEISSDFDTQLQTVTELGMEYISIRGVNEKNFSEYSIDELKTYIKPKLEEYKVKVSSIGSPIGKVFIDDEEGFNKQVDLLEKLCEMASILECKYIRMFSFYMPKGKNPDDYRDEVIKKLNIFTEIAKKHNIILLHENEKDIYGDISSRCLDILKSVNSDNFKAIFDFANFVQCMENTKECYELLKEYIVYYHIKDANKRDNQNVVCATGEGKIEEILTDAIKNGYKGFVTMEPHLVIFDSLKDLELEDVNEIIKEDKGLDGKSAYALQYKSLVNILGKIEFRLNKFGGDDMKQVRFGIVGIGQMGGSHASWLAEGKVAGAKLTAVCDINPAKKEWANEKLPKDVKFFDNYIDMLDSKEIDAVLIATPHYDHPVIAIEALNRDLHTLVEKPAGVYTKKIREMNELAESKPHLVFGMMFNQRTNPLYQRIKEIVDNGEIGEIRRTNWIITTWWRPQAYYDMSDWRATWSGEGGGVLANQAPHQLDLWQWICGMPTKVRANLQFGSHRNIAVEDDVTAFVEYENGATGTFITCTHDILGTDRFEIHGDKGKIVVEGSKKVTVKRMKESENELNKRLTFADVANLFRGEGMGDLFEVEEFEIPDQWGVQHINVMINFTEAILEGKKLLAPGTDGINGVILSNAMHLSSWTGKDIELPFDEDLYLEELNKRREAEKANA